MSLILSIETSSQLCSVALHEQGRLISASQSEEEGAHAKRLTLLIEDVVKKAATQLSSLVGIAISIGPGSYTGLRIGLATAKGLCFGLDKPLIAVPTLKILAARHEGSIPYQILIPVLDARRMEVYTAVYARENLEELESAHALILNDFSFGAYQQKNALIFGNGAQKFKDSFPDHTFSYDLENPSPEATYMGKLAYEAYLNKSFENLISVEPAYLKEYMGQKPLKKIFNGAID
jgi:tRNA threonylcarbamoyladenosine biosynthesis protein TsaB